MPRSKPSWWTPKRSVRSPTPLSTPPNTTRKRSALPPRKSPKTLHTKTRTPPPRPPMNDPKPPLMKTLLLLLLSATPAFCAEGTTYARFVPERKDDFAWENDLVAFRTYGPALRQGPEDSGIDCWLKRVTHPIIDKWYEGNTKGVSYHKDHGEGYDPYHVGGSRGCGGTALWVDGAMVTSDTFTDWKILEQTPAKTVFELTYQYPAVGTGAPIREVKRITIVPGQRFFRSDSTFTRDGQPVAGLPVAIGVTTHDGKAAPALSPENRWVSCWEKIGDSGLGTGVVLAPGFPIETKELAVTEKDKSHALILTATDSQGLVTCYPGYGWEKAGVITTPEAWAGELTAFSKSLQ
ncbi:MAG: DUF4861 domain-containing protein [Chthoniobacterales bacterium]|nr:DUF4861 domain-containing protein [Chthoniobacterales bacterium]